MKISDELISGFLYGTIDLKDEYYEEAKSEDEAFSEVFDSSYPSYMEVQRPNEADKQVKYRKDFFEATGNPISGFLGLIEKQIDKVFSSDDFRVIFKEKSKLPDVTQTAEWYFTKGYYNGRDLLKSFSESIKTKTLLEPNSVLAIIPSDGKDYPEPYYLIVDADEVLYYKANEFCLLKSELKSDILADDGSVLSDAGDIHYFFDTEYFVVTKHIGYNQDGTAKYSVVKKKHGCSFLPCKKIGRKVKEQTEDGHELRTSDLSDSLVFLRLAQMNSNDLAVEHNFHVATRSYVIGTIDCSDCGGRGMVKNPQGGKAIKCSSCGGAGKKAAYSGSGADEMIIPMDVNSLGKSDKTPTIGGGFIARPETGAKIFAEAYERNVKLALRPFGLENAIITPYNQSGNSKDKDMQEGYAFMMSMSYHMEELLQFLIDSIIEQRYQTLSKELRELERPSLTVPKKFNLSSADSLYNKLKEASQNGMPDTMKLKYVKQLVEKESGLNSDEYLLVKAKEKLDPLPAYTFQQKVLARNTLSDLKYVLTINIDAILNECNEENDGFLMMDYKAQRDIVNKKAQEYLLEAKDNLQRDFQVKPSTNIVSENQTV